MTLASIEYDDHAEKCETAQSHGETTSLDSKPEVSGDRSMAMAEKPTLTTSTGAPLSDNQNALTAGARGPLLM
jgi:hypothetical protein